MRRSERHPAQRLRASIEALPQRTKEAMLRGIDANRIVVGTYVDSESGGICPMLAAHRNGGRTSLASFARAWDAYTGAKRPRRATWREVRALRSLLESSLARQDLPAEGSIAELAAQIRAEREALARTSEPRPEEPVDEPERRIRIRRRQPDAYLDLLAVAEAALADQGAWERLDEREGVEP